MRNGFTISVPSSRRASSFRSTRSVPSRLKRLHELVPSGASEPSGDAHPAWWPLRAVLDSLFQSGCPPSHVDAIRSFPLRERRLHERLIAAPARVPVISAMQFAKVMKRFREDTLRPVLLPGSRDRSPGGGFVCDVLAILELKSPRRVAARCLAEPPKLAPGETPPRSRSSTPRPTSCGRAQARVQVG